MSSHGAISGRHGGGGIRTLEGLTTPSDFRDRRILVAAILGTPLEHIAGALWTSADFYGLGGLARLPHLQGNRGIRDLDALNS
jgi:hypothetical protein